jgi:hypothetical protein
MFRTQWTPHPGFEESLLSLREDLPPILRLRIVKSTEYAYEPFVYDYQTREIIASTGIPIAMINAQEKAVALAMTFLKDCIEVNAVYII